MKATCNGCHINSKKMYVTPIFHPSAYIIMCISTWEVVMVGEGYM